MLTNNSYPPALGPPRQARATRDADRARRPAELGHGGGAAARTGRACPRARWPGSHRGAAGARRRHRRAGRSGRHRAPSTRSWSGLDPSFDYASLAVAAKALHGGARLIGTNEDATFPTADGALPGAGSLLAAVACAGQATPVVAGKPHAPTVGLVNERIGDVEMVVGDRPRPTALLARRLGTRFGLVLTGVTPPGHGPFDPEPDLEAPTCFASSRATCR